MNSNNDESYAEPDDIHNRMKELRQFDADMDIIAIFGDSMLKISKEKMSLGLLPITADLPLPADTIRGALTRALKYDRVPDNMKKSASGGLAFLELCKLGDKSTET